VNVYFTCYSKRAADNKERVRFETEFCRALEKISPETIEKLYEDDNWRTHLVASWFCAVKNYTQLSDRIASELMVDRSGYAGQGHCIALYSFADERSIAHMCDYLDHWLIWSVVGLDYLRTLANQGHGETNGN